MTGAQQRNKTMRGIVPAPAPTQSERRVQTAFRCAADNGQVHFTRPHSASWLASGLLACAVSLAAHAHEDHDRARAALRAGEALPLPQLMERIGKEYPGRLLDVEREEKQGRLIYEIKLLAGDGSLTKLWVDAKSGQVMRTRAVR